MDTDQMSRTPRIVRVAIVAAYVVGVAGVASVALSVLFVAAGEPWGTLIDVALLVMTGAIAPLMLAFYELGGLTPTPLARVAQAAGWMAVLTWCVVEVLMIVGAIGFEFDRAAGGPFAVWAGALVVIGSWVGGANLLAGPWLGRVRWLGVVAGIGVMALGIGLLLGGANQPLTYLGGVIYQFGVPVWGLLMARELRLLDR
jgi:hypothetical protein